MIPLRKSEHSERRCYIYNYVCVCMCVCECVWGVWGGCLCGDRGGCRWVDVGVFPRKFRFIVKIKNDIEENNV